MQNLEILKPLKTLFLFSYLFYLGVLRSLFADFNHFVHLVSIAFEKNLKLSVFQISCESFDIMSFSVFFYEPAEKNTLNRAFNIKPDGFLHENRNQRKFNNFVEKDL